MRRLTYEQRTRLIVRQAPPEWKAEQERRMDAGILAGTHVLCVVCGMKDKRPDPRYDICVSCGVRPWRRTQVAEAMAAADRKAGR